MSKNEPMPLSFVGVRPHGEPTYLGDGVYASFDGYHLWLSADSHTSPKRVALEPQILANFLEYARRYWILPDNKDSGT